MDSIPVVSLADGAGRDVAARREAAASLRQALQELGFVRISDPGVDPALVARVYGHFERFFSLAADEKAACAGVAGGQRGFTPFGVEHAKDHPAPDLKEFFHVGQPGPAASAGSNPYGYPPNLWPAGMPGLARDAVALFRALEDCAIRILELLAFAFDLPADVFAKPVEGGNSILRALHYPPLSAPPLSAPPLSAPPLGAPTGSAPTGGAPTGGPPGCVASPDPRSVRAAPHEDINLVTLLCDATDAGLEIKPPGRSEWIAVETAPGEIVADSGDMLSRLTNDVIPATTHRVISPPGCEGRHRYSLPFFAHPRPDADLSVLPRFVTDSRPPRHPPITAGAYLQERLREIGLVS